MAYRTTPAFVHVGVRDEEARTHSALKWLGHHTKDTIDSREFELPATFAGHTKVWTLRKAPAKSSRAPTEPGRSWQLRYMLPSAPMSMIHVS